MATQSELAQIQHILGKRRSADHNPLDLSARKKSREYLDSHKDVEKRRRDRINTCLDTIRTLVPLCHQLPRHRRVDKADLLDLAIIYLRMVNKFLEKIGITDIFSAAHQQVGLFTSLEKWVRHHGEKCTDVPTFAKEILGLLEREMETATHVIASQQTTTSSAAPEADAALQQDGAEWMKHEHGSPEENPSTPRSYQQSSGSDEESLGSCHGDRDARNSVSDDPVASPSCHMSRVDFMRKCQNSYSREESFGAYSNGFGDCGCPLSNGYHDMHCRYSCQASPKPVCHDKGVNTDASSTNYLWPSDVTFTLPIISGKIVLHTPKGANGSNNLNAPVAVHAEIHSSPCPNPEQACKQLPAPESEGHFRSDRESVVSASPERWASPPAAITVSRPDAPVYPASHTSCPVPYPSTHYPFENSPEGPVAARPAAHRPDRHCVNLERRQPSAYLEEIYRGERREEQTYTPLAPRQCPEEKDASFPVSRSPQAADAPRCSDSCCNGQSDGPFSKRFLASLGHHQTESNINNNNDNAPRSQFSDRFPTASSSLKLKSLMVHRHQAQHVLS